MGALMDLSSRCVLLMVFARSCSHASSMNDLHHPCPTYTGNAPIMRRLSLLFAVAPPVSAMPTVIDHWRASIGRVATQSHQIEAPQSSHINGSVRPIRRQGLFIWYQVLR
ncbi:hypothetical protein B0T12DRAFT_417960 [Alternaria alternata]|nr:hypothetical protein B0T12DRAFT_417960 [Alternaria alternata]